MHKHSARRLHYDLRLEIDGVLKSWAVPKGPSVRSHEKRLAVHVEDHPLEYGDFEGVIPEGNYGAGPSIVWDAGRFRLVKPEPAREQIERGKLEFELFGFKLRGRWTLARMSGKDKEWLLLKKADAYAGEAEPTERFPASVLSGLTVEELRDGPQRIETLRQRLTELGAPRADIAPRGELVMLATLVETPPTDPDWLFEIKYDGVRVLAHRADDTVELRGRSGQVVTSRYPEVAAALRALPLARLPAGRRDRCARRRAGARAFSGSRSAWVSRAPPTSSARAPRCRSAWSSSTRSGSTAAICAGCRSRRARNA